MLRIPAYAIATITAVMVMSAVPALSQDGATSPRLTELLTEQEGLLAEAEELGGSRLLREAIVNKQGEIYELRELINTFEAVADDLQITQDELRAMQREAESVSTMPGGSEDEKAARKLVEGAAKRVLKGVTKQVAKGIGYVADAAEWGFRTYLKRQNVATMRGYVRDGLLKQREVSQLLRASYESIAHEERQRRRLVQIQERTRAIFDEVAEERRRIAEAALPAGPATDNAVLTPDQDPAGDEEEREKYNEEGVVPAGKVVEIDWRRDDLGLNEIDTYLCPPNPDRRFSSDSLVGTDRYLTKSPVCVAAAHAGVITVELGGRLRLRTFAGKDGDEYRGSERNGIKSGSWNRNWGGYSVSQPY